MRKIILSVVLLAAVVVILVTPWYPAVTTQTTSQTFTYTYETPSQTTQFASIYNLPNTVSLEGWFQSGAAFSNVYQELGDISLQSGSSITVQLQQCQACDTALTKDFGDKATIFSLEGPGTGDFVVPESGQYKISVLNFGSSEDKISSISITAEEPQITVASQTGYNTVDVTKYLVSMVPVYTVLGTLLSAFVLILVAILVILTTLFDRGIITMSTRRRRR